MSFPKKAFALPWLTTIQERVPLMDCNHCIPEHTDGELLLLRVGNVRQEQALAYGAP